MPKLLTIAAAGALALLGACAHAPPRGVRLAVPVDYYRLPNGDRKSVV